MSLIHKFKTGRYTRLLKSSGSVPLTVLGEAKAQLVSMGPSALQPVLRLLGSPEARRPAMDVLAGLLSEETLPVYLAALGSPETAVVSGVAEVLARGRNYDPARLLDLFSDPAIPKARLEAILAERMDGIQPRLLVSMLAEMNKDARAVVFRLLERHSDASITGEAVKLLQHPDWWMRLHMVRLLGCHASPEGIAGASQLLKDENRGVRFEAVKTLGRLRAREAVKPLCQALRDADLKVHTAAIDALLAIGDASAVPHLVEVLKDESEYARRGAVEVLNEVATTDAIKDLVLALRDADWWVRVRAADALGTLGGERVVEAVIGLLGDEDDFIRRYAVEILNTVTNPRAVEPLIRTLDDPDWWVRERSIDALAKIGDARAVDPLVALLHRDAQAASLCVRALRDIGDPRAVKPLCRLVDSDNEEIRREAVETLAAFSRKSLDPGIRAGVMAALEASGLPSDRSAGRPLAVRNRHAAGDPEFGRSAGEARPGTPPGPAGAPLRRSGGDDAGGAGSDGAPGGSESARRPAERVRSGPVNFRELASGDRLADRYRVIRRIGGGGFGTVYLVEDMMVKDELILKILSPYLSLDEGMIRRFVQELKLARRITHPNIIRIHDFLELGGGHAISMEYFPGGDLARLLKSGGPLPPARGINLACQVCDALAAAHEKGVIHRDVKPANVLVGQDDLVKLVDFGLAAVGQQMGSRLTRSGLLIGTPEYMAPEQISGQAVDGRADIYALGVLMYEMFSGVQPFAGENAVAILFQHLEGEVQPLSRVAPPVTPELERVVMSAMARNPDDRAATAVELRRMLVNV